MKLKKRLLFYRVVEDFLSNRINEEDALALLKGDTELQEAFKQYIALKKSYSRFQSRARPSPGLPEKIMRQIQAQPVVVERAPLFLKVYAAALTAVLCILIPAAIFLSLHHQPKTSPDVVYVKFVLHRPGARSVSIVGDFNDWNPSATPMEDLDGDGTWVAVVPLKKGRYNYAFVVNNSLWIPDPLATDYVKDGFGNVNSVLKLSYEKQGAF